LRSRRAQRAWSPSVNRRFSAIRADSFASHSWPAPASPSPPSRPGPPAKAPPPASSPPEAAPTPAGPAPPDGPKPGNSPLPPRPKTPAPGPPPPPHGTGAHRWWAAQNLQPGPLPPDPPPRPIGVHRHRVPKGLHQLRMDRLRQPLIGLAQARTPQATRNNSATFRETPPPMLQVRRQRPRLPPPPSPTTPAGDGATPPLPTSTPVAPLRPKPRDDRLMGGPVLQGSPTRRTRLHRLPDGLLGRPTPAPVSAHPGKRAPPNAVPAAPRLPGRRAASAPPPTAPGAVPIQPRAADHSDNWTSQSSSSI